MFQDMVLTLGESAVEDCQDSSVHHATMPRHNWYLEDGAIVEILEEEDPDLPDSSLGILNELITYCWTHAAFLMPHVVRNKDCSSK